MKLHWSMWFLWPFKKKLRKTSNLQENDDKVCWNSVSAVCTPCGNSRQFSISKSKFLHKILMSKITEKTFGTLKYFATDEQWIQELPLGPFPLLTFKSGWQVCEQTFLTSTNNRILTKFKFSNCRQNFFPWKFEFHMWIRNYIAL